MVMILRALFAAAIILVLVTPADSRASSRKIRMGVFVVDPLVKKSGDGSFSGSVIEVIEHIASLEDWELEYVECDLTECLGMLEAAEIDLMGSITLTEDRLGRFDYTNETFFMDWGQIYAPRGSRIKSLLDLEGKRIAAFPSTAQYPEFMKLLRSFEIIIEPVFVKEYIDVFRYVEKGRADALMVNRLFGERHLRGFDVKKTPIVFNPMDIRFATPKGRNSDLRDAIDWNLGRLRFEDDSMYYAAVSRMMGENGLEARIPVWAKAFAMAMVSAAVFLAGITLWLRREVGRRTVALREEIEERKGVERRLSEGKATFETLVEFTHAIHWEMDIASGRFLYISPQIEQILGYNPGKWISMDDWAMTIHPEDREWVVSFCNEQSREGKGHEFIYRALAADGRTIWLRDIVSVISDEGVPRKCVGVMFDITSQKRIEEALASSLNDKELLLQEIHHRVKNNLAIVSAFMSLQADKAGDPETGRLFRESQSRIRSMALVHEKLYMREDLSKVDFGSYLRSLEEELARSYGFLEGRLRFSHDTEPVPLGLDALIPCGLIINELITNAMKYAFEDTPAPEIRIGLRKTGSGSALLTVWDNGRGMPDGFDITKTPTLGLRIVRQLADQLGGTLTVESDGGARFVLEFGLDGEDDG